MPAIRMTAYFMGRLSCLSLAKGRALSASKPMMMALSVTYSGWLASPINPAMDCSETNHQSGNGQGGNKQGSAQSIVNILNIFLALHKPEIGRFKSKKDQSIQKGN